MAHTVRAILLASAIAASFLGLRASKLSSQGEVRPGLAKRICAMAPSTSRRRRLSSPCRLIRPGRCRPAVECSRGVMTSAAAKCRPERKALGSLTLSEKLPAPIGPMPGWVTRHWLIGSALCSAISRISRALSWASSASSWRDSTPSISRASAGTPAASASARCSSSATLTGPLAALDIGLDVLRWHQHHRVPQAAQHSRPVMRGSTGLDADPGRGQLAKELSHFAAPYLPAQHRLLGFVDAMHLKDMLGGIQANPDNRHWAAPLAALFKPSQPGTFDAVGGRPPQHKHRLLEYGFRARSLRPRPGMTGLYVQSGLQGREGSRRLVGRRANPHLA